MYTIGFINYGPRDSLRLHWTCQLLLLLTYLVFLNVVFIAFAFLNIVQHELQNWALIDIPRKKSSRHGKTRTKRKNLCICSEKCYFEVFYSQVYICTFYSSNSLPFNSIPVPLIRTSLAICSPSANNTERTKHQKTKEGIDKARLERELSGHTYIRFGEPLDDGFDRSTCCVQGKG